MATEDDTPESVSTMKSGREEKELLSELQNIEFPSNGEKKPEARPNQYLEASSYEGQPKNTPLVININVAEENNVTEDTAGTDQGVCFFKSPPVSEVATDESSCIPRDPAIAKMQNKTGLFEIETLEEEILKDQTVLIDPPKEACSDNELKPSTEEEPEESQRDERGSLMVDEVVTLANSGQVVDSLQMIGVSETKEVCNYSTIGNSTSDSAQGINYKRDKVNEVESEEIEKKSEQHELLNNAKEDDRISLTDHNAEEAMENDNAAKEKIGRPYIAALTEEHSSEEAGRERGKHSQSSNIETKEKIEEVQVKEHNLIFLPKYEIGMESCYRSIDGASGRTVETVPYFEGKSLIGTPEEILEQEIPQKMIHAHEISEKGSPDIKAKAKYENDGLNEEIEERNTAESAYKTNLPIPATGEETAEENLKEDETVAPKPKEVKNLGMESVQGFDTKCHIESKIAEDMTDDINPDEDCHTQGSRGLSEEIQLKEISEDLVGSSSFSQVSQKETEDETMEKTLSIITEETSAKEVEREQKTELDMSNLLFEENSRETEAGSDDVNSTSKLTEASKIGDNTNIQFSESAKNEADEAGTMCESLGETHTTLPEGEDEKEATSCETPSSALSDQTLQESSAPLIAESKLGTTEVSEMIDNNPDKEVFHINTHNPLAAETTGEKLEQNKFEPMDPINDNLVELIDIPMDSVHAAEKNPESVEPQKLRSSTILLTKDQSSETFIEVNKTKMDEDTESVIEHNPGAADTNAKEKIFGGNDQECQNERSKEVESKSEAGRQTQSGIETVNNVVLIEELLKEVEKPKESENIKEQMVQEENCATKLQMAFSSDKEPNKNHKAAGIIENLETSGLQVVEDINWEPEAYSITKAPEEEMIKAEEKPINNTSSPYELLHENATEAKVGIHREKAETAPATVPTLEIRSDGVQLVNISESDLNATTGDNSLGVHGTVQGEAADIMEPEDSTEISQCTTTEHADVNKQTVVVENPVTNETEVEELNTSVENEITSITETAKLQEAENIHLEPEASSITKEPEGPEEEIVKIVEKHINITSSKNLLLEENVRQEKMEVGDHGSKAETTAAAAMTVEAGCGGAQLANNSASDSDKTVGENNLGIHSPQGEATADLEFEGNYVKSQLTTTEHAEVTKEPLVVDYPATDETQIEENKISLAEPTIGDTETARLHAVDDIERDPEASSITKTQEEELMKGAEKPTNISSSSIALSEEDSREEKLEKVGVHEDDSETTATTMMTAETSSEEVQPASKSARDLDTTADENTLEFHTTTIEGEAVSSVELENFSERCQLTTTEYADVYNETMVLEKRATAETEAEELKISNTYPTVSNVETEQLQMVEDINWEPEASTLTKAPDEETTKGAEKPINVTSSASELSEECSREEMVEEVGNLGDDAETAPATLMTAETDSEGVQLANVSARDLVTTEGDNSLGLHTNLQGEVDDNMELQDTSVMSQLTKPEHADVYKDTMMLEKSATYETGVEELQIPNAERNSSEQFVHHIHENDEISTMESSEMYTCEEVTILEALAEGDTVPNVTHADRHLIKQFQGPSSATTAEKVEDEITMEKETLVNELELEIVEDKRIDGSGESPTEEPTYLREATSAEPQEYISIIQSAESSPGCQEELEDIRHFSSLEPSKEDTLDSAELNTEKELEPVGESENISDKGMAAEEPYLNSNREVADKNSCSQEADRRNVEEAPIRPDHPETKAPNEEVMFNTKQNVESHEEPRSASITKVDEQLNGTTSVPKKVDTDENSINDEGKLDSTEIKVTEQDPYDVEMEMSNESALENKNNTKEDCIETLKDVIFLKEIEQVTVEKSEDIKGQICEQDTCTQETTSSHEVLNETTYSDRVPIEKLEATILSPEMKQGTEKPVNGSRSVLEGSEEDIGEEKIEEGALVNGRTDTPPATFVSETSSENVQLGEKFMKDYDTENQIEKATEVNETAEDTLVSGMIAEDNEVVESFLGTNLIPIEELSEGLRQVDAQKTEEHVKGLWNAIVNSSLDSVAKGTANEGLPQQTTDKKNADETPYETDQIEIEAETTILSEEIAYLDPVPTEYREAIDSNVETEREKLRSAEYLNWESEASSITKSPETAKKDTEKPADITSSVIDVPVEKSRELKSEADIFNANTATLPGTLVMLLSLEEVQQGEMVIKGSDMTSTDENLNTKMTHTSQEDEEVGSFKLEETFVGKKIVTTQNPAKEKLSDTVSTSIEQDPKDVLDMDKVQHELTEVPAFIDEEVIQDLMATDSIPMQELSEELQRVDVQEKAEEHVISAGNAVVEFYQESDAKGTVNKNLAQETDEENENPSNLERQEMEEETEHTQINAKTTVPTEEIAYSDPVPTGYLEALDLNVDTEREELRDEEDLNWESETSSITKPPENEEKKCTEKPVDITSSVIDVPEAKSTELKSETDVFSASTPTSPGTPVMETSLEEVQQCETLIKGSDMKLTGENLNIKITHTSQEDEEVDSMKLEETLSGKDIVFAEKPNANEGEPEEIVASDTISTSIEQDPTDVLDMDKVQHELTQVPKIITENKEVAKDFIVTNSIPIQELSEELQRVVAEENSKEHATGSGMPGSTVVDIYQESVAERTTNENLAQETNEEKTVMETPCDLEVQETGEEPEHMEINAVTTVLAEEIAYSDTVPTGYLEAIDLNVETAREELRGGEDLNWESKVSSIRKPPDIEEKKGIEKPVNITSSVIDVPEKNSRELKSETYIFNASTATPPETLVMERSLAEVQQGETLIKGSDMKSTDENVNAKMTHAAQEDEEVDSFKLEETFVVKEIEIAGKPAAHKDEAEEILTSDTVSTSIEQNPQHVLEMDNVQHELTEVPGFVAEDKEVTKDFKATNTFPVQELSEELQRVDVQEKAEEHVTGARSAVMDFHQESFAKGTANKHIAQETNEKNIVEEAPSDLELQATAEEPECIEINAETTVLTEENLEAVEPHDELLSAHEYVADGQIDEPLPQTNKSNGKDSNDQNLESTIEKIIEQDYLGDQSEMYEFVEHKFGETQGGHETTKDIILVEKAVVDIQEVEEASCIQELKRISESDEKTSMRINSEPIPIDNLEAIGSITDTEEVKLLTSEDLSWNSGSPFATDAPEEDKKQGIENTSCDNSSEFEESEKMVKEENMEKADADSKESENLNNPDAGESEVDKSVHFDAVSKSKKKVMEDIQRNGEGVTAVSIGVHEAIEAVVGPDKNPDRATNLTEKFHEPLSEMLYKEQAVETATTTKNFEDEGPQKDATLLNEYMEDTLSTRTIDAALLQKETPKGLQVSPPGFELNAVKQNESPNEAAKDEWTIVEETAAVEPQADVYKMKIEDSLIPSPTYIPGNAVESFKEDRIQDFQKAEKVLESTPETPLSAVTKSKVAEIKEEHHKRATTTRVDGEIQNEITDETTGTIKKKKLSEKTTLDEEVAKDSLVVSADEEKIKSSYHEDELETLEYPEEITSQELETKKRATHAEELDPTTDIEEQTLAESTPVKEVHQEFPGDRTVIAIHPEEINDEKIVKGVPTIINLHEESYETNSRDTNTEDTMIIEEVNISEVELLKHVEDGALPVEKNNLTPNYEAQSTHPEASANKKVGEAEDVFAIAHPVQEMIKVHGGNTNTEKEDNNIPDCLVNAEKPEHTPAESTFDRNIGTESLNQREQEKAKDYPAISRKDGTMDLTVTTEMAPGVQMLAEKSYVSTSDKQIMAEADSDYQSSKPEVSTPELESNSADTGEETIMIDEVKEQTEKPLIALPELLSRSTEGTSQVAERLIDQESETTDKKGLQADSDEDRGEKEEEEEGGENQKADSGSDAPVMVEASSDMDVKVCKKSHGILSGVGSKVKHSISKVKKVITRKSSHPKP